MGKFYLTTPIYYVNDRPHIGHAYTTFAADAIAAWHRMRGDETFFLTGTDENAQKNVEAAAGRLGKATDAVTRTEVQAYVDAMSAAWSQTWDSLGVRYDRFIRTTEASHIHGVEQFIAAVRGRNPDDIYRGTYTGWYCVGCEAFITDQESGIRNQESGGSVPTCPTHQRPLERIEEENYFFRLSRYREALLKYIERNPQFVQPEARRNEIVSYINQHLTDTSISRPMRNWGIPFPGDPTQVVYVWFDALTNYLTGVEYGQPTTPTPTLSPSRGEGEKKEGEGSAFADWWPAQLHLVGKDIIKFHCALWPAMLMSAGLPLPERVFAHGFFTIEGKKMSKSLGNVVDPVQIAERYGLDALRYFLLREIPFGGDGDFSEDRLRQRYASDLQHGIGNLAARIVTMVGKYCEGVIPGPFPVAQERVNQQAGKPRVLRRPKDGKTPEVEEPAVGIGHAADERPGETVATAWRAYTNAMDAIEPHVALEAVWNLIRTTDQYIEEQKPWALAKDGAQRDHLLTVLGTLCETLRHIALMLAPFLPTTADKILSALGQEHWRAARLVDLQRWGGILEGTKAGKLEHLFPPLQ